MALDYPGGIWINDDDEVYVADIGNHRVMKWRLGWQSGVLVAGGNGPGDGLHQLNQPMDVAVDADGFLIVADFGNTRVSKWMDADVEERADSLIRAVMCIDQFAKDMKD